MTSLESEQIEAVKAELRVLREQVLCGNRKAVVLELMILNLKRTIEQLTERAEGNDIRRRATEARTPRFGGAL